MRSEMHQVDNRLPFVLSFQRCFHSILWRFPEEDGGNAYLQPKKTTEPPRVFTGDYWGVDNNIPGNKLLTVYKLVGMRGARFCRCHQQYNNRRRYPVTPRWLMSRCCYLPTQHDLDHVLSWIYPIFAVRSPGSLLTRTNNYTIFHVMLFALMRGITGYTVWTHPISETSRKVTMYITGRGYQRTKGCSPASTMPSRLRSLVQNNVRLLSVVRSAKTNNSECIYCVEAKSK